MMGAERFIRLASTAPPLPTGMSISFLLVNGRNLAIFRKPAWIYIASSIIAYPDAGSEYIDLPDFIFPEWRRLKPEEKVLRCVGEEADQHADRWNSQLRYCKVITEHLQLASISIQDTEGEVLDVFKSCLLGAD